VTRVRPVGSFAALTFHGLAHVPLAGVASLFEPAYVAWCAATMLPDAREPLAADGPGIGAEIDREGTALAVQWLPRIHVEIASFVNAATTDLAMLGAADEATALAALRTAPPVGIEWLRADLALAARAFDSWRASREPALREHADAVAAALVLAPVAVRPRLVRVSWSLGSRGRGFEDEVVVGAPAAWNGLDARAPAAVAIHEHAVVLARGDYAEREWSALRSVSRALEGTALEPAHAAWLASRDLGALARVVPPGLREQLDAEPTRRAERLARLSP
jgi:hypothetical protein